MSQSYKKPIDKCIKLLNRSQVRRENKYNNTKYKRKKNINVTPSINLHHSNSDGYNSARHTASTLGNKTDKM